MSPADWERKLAPAGRNRFETTNWSLILAAGQRPTGDSMEALEGLSRTCWYPLYAYVRRRGCSVEEAEDLTQGFFARLLEKNYPKEVRRTREAGARSYKQVRAELGKSEGAVTVHRLRRRAEER